MQEKFIFKYNDTFKKKSLHTSENTDVMLFPNSFVNFSFSFPMTFSLSPSKQYMFDIFWNSRY